MKKIIAIILCAAALSALVAQAAVASDLGSGAAVVANDVRIVKSTLYGKKLSFSDVDFKQGLCLTDFKSITITKLPKSAEGTLMLAGRRVSEGATIKRKNLASLVFIPTDKEVKEAQFLFTIDEYASGEEIPFVIRFTDKINYEPTVKDEATAATLLKTQREIGAHGRMFAEDGEGDELEFIIVSYPECGTLDLVDRKSGEFVYMPDESFVGKDSFVYVARDSYGNFSETATVSITVSERMSEVKYADMTERAEYNAAVALTAMGIMNGRVIGDGTYFSPDESVSRAEFTAMALKALGIRADSSIGATYFDDNDEIPKPLLGYIATAQRIGVINGVFEDGKLSFNPNDAITKYDAAMIMASLTDLKSSESSVVITENVPVWATESVEVMCEAGVLQASDGVIDGGAVVTRADAARYLYRLIEIS